MFEHRYTRNCKVIGVGYLLYSGECDDTRNCKVIGFLLGSLLWDSRFLICLLLPDAHNHSFSISCHIPFLFTYTCCLSCFHLVLHDYSCDICRITQVHNINFPILDLRSSDRTDLALKMCDLALRFRNRDEDLEQNGKKWKEAWCFGL